MGNIIHNFAEYKLVKSGTNCNYITTNAECDKAVEELTASGDMTEQKAMTTDYDYDFDDKPPYCFYYVMYGEYGLYFNTNAQGNTTPCSAEHNCVCKI